LNEAINLYTRPISEADNKREAHLAKI